MSYSDLSRLHDKVDSLEYQVEEKDKTIKKLNDLVLASSQEKLAVQAKNEKLEADKARLEGALKSILTLPENNSNFARTIAKSTLKALQQPVSDNEGKE